MNEWTTLIPELGSLPELVALVCLFVLNNALWMRLLFRFQDEGAKVLWEAVRQLTVLTQEIAAFKEWLEFQTQLLEAHVEAQTQGPQDADKM